jgi:hypothetical protein
LKQKPAKKWIWENCDPESTIIYVGIDWTETHRMEGVARGYHPYRVAAPLTVEPFLTKKQMIEMTESWGITAPKLYKLGFKHNNCGGGCVRAGQAQWKHLLDVMPERYAEWEKQEIKMQDYLGKEDITILARVVNGKKVPLSLTDLRTMAQNQPALIDMNDQGVSCNCVSTFSA